MKHFSWSLRAFAEPRLGNSPADYEDAWDRFPQRRDSGAVLRVALADGATASSFAAEWAGLLTRAFVRHGFLTEQGLTRAITIAARTWRQSVFARPLPWYAEEKARRGAFSSLLGIHLTASPNPGSDAHPWAGEWTALAVGDTCLFHIRDNRLLTSFPLSAPEEFSDTPALLSSRITQNSAASVHILRGHWQAGDRFILASDALASWILQETRVETAQPWAVLAGLPDQATFRHWLTETRSTRRIRNDDTTCLLIDPHPG